MAKPIPPYKRKYNNETRNKRLALCIMIRMENHTEWLRKACGRYCVPPSTFLDWVDTYGMNERYTRAKETLGHLLVEQAVDLCDSKLERDDKGNVDRGAVDQLRIRVDTRKWITTKITKQFAEKRQIDMQVKDISLQEILKDKGK